LESEDGSHSGGESGEGSTSCDRLPCSARRRRGAQRVFLLRCRRSSQGWLRRAAGDRTLSWDIVVAVVVQVGVGGRRRGRGVRGRCGGLRRESLRWGVGGGGGCGRGMGGGGGGGGNGGRGGGGGGGRGGGGGGGFRRRLGRFRLLGLGAGPRSGCLGGCGEAGRSQEEDDQHGGAIHFPAKSRD
ncbi:unnamed protein product, partial [Musa hybrid cultivar]